MTQSYYIGKCIHYTMLLCIVFSSTSDTGFLCLCLCLLHLKRMDSLAIPTQVTKF